MIDTDDLDRLLRDELTAASDRHEAPGDPTQRVATRVRRRRTRRTAVRVSLAASVTVIAALALAFTRATDGTAPAHRPPEPPPSVLSTPQVAGDRFARTLLGDLDAPIDWASVRLLQQQGQARVFGARTTQARLCVIVVSPDSAGQLSAGTDCGPNRPLTSQDPPSRFAARGAFVAAYAKGTNVIGYFVPDTVRSAAVDGVPVPVTRNGVLVVFKSADMPKSITLSSAKGTVTIRFTRDGGVPSPTATGSFE